MKKDHCSSSGINCTFLASQVLVCYLEVRRSRSRVAEAEFCLALEIQPMMICWSERKRRKKLKRGIMNFVNWSTFISRRSWVDLVSVLFASLFNDYYRSSIYMHMGSNAEGRIGKVSSTSLLVHRQLSKNRLLFIFPLSLFRESKCFTFSNENRTLCCFFQLHFLIFHEGYVYLNGWSLKFALVKLISPLFTGSLTSDWS